MSPRPTVDQLQPRIRKVLADLSVVSEASAGRSLDDSDRNTAPRAPGARLPPGVMLTDESILTESSLYDEHVESLAALLEQRPEDHALDDEWIEQLEDWLIQAEHDRDWAKWKAPDGPKLEDPAQWRERVVKPWTAGGHQGVHYVDAARAEGVSPSLIRDARKRFGREQRYGEPLPDRQMSEPGGSDSSDSGKRAP